MTWLRPPDPPDDKVVGLDGKPVAAPVQPHAGVVDLLERVLADAREGKIDSVVIAYTTPEPDGTHFFKSCWEGPQITMLGSIARAQYALNCSLDKQDKGDAFND